MDEPQTSETEQLPLRQIGRDEMNLAEFPITLLTERIPKGLKTLVFEGREGRLMVLGSDAYGLPTALDADVIVALIQHTKQVNDFTRRTVPFSRYGLLRRLGWPDRGENYRRLSESLKRWTTVSLNYEKAWWDNKAKCSIDATFHILDSVVIVEEETRKKLRARGQQEELPFSSFTWNEIFLRSCQADNLKRLDLGIYFSLKSSISKQIYRFLDKRFYHRPAWTFDLREFAYGHVGLSRGYADNGILKEKLRPALEELEAIGFLEPMSREERYTPVRRGEWAINLARSKGAGPAESMLEPKTLEPSKPEPTQLEQELAKRGVTGATATELVTVHPPEHIEQKLEVFDWLTERRDKRVQKNPAGYLVESIRKHYASPKGFEFKADREKRLQAEEAKRRAEQDAARRKLTQKHRDEEIARQAKQLWESLTDEERQQLDAQALADADEETRRQYEETQAGPSRRLLLVGIRQAYIRKLVETAPEAL